MKNEIFCYHGSSLEVMFPSLSYSRNDIDFGIGFYLTQDERMAKKWACNKQNSVLNVYKLNLDQLNIYHFNADIEWLEYCVANRFQEIPTFDDSKYDVLIGPTADDKLFSTLDLYVDGILSPEETIEVINCMNISEQVVVKKQNVLNNNLIFQSSKEIFGLEKQSYIVQFQEERKEANIKSQNLIQSFKHSGRGR